MTTASQTPIRTFQDILDIMAANPELRASMRQHVLHEEVRQLPAAYQRLAESQTEMQEAISRLTAEMAELREIVARLAEEVAELKEIVARLSAEMAELREIVARLSAEMAELREIVARLSAEMAELREIVARLSAEVAELREIVTRLVETVSHIVARQDRMERRAAVTAGHLARIAGSQYEQAIAAIAPRIAREELNFIAPAVTHRAWQTGAFLADAVNSPSITTRQAADLNRADLVISGRTPDNQPIHALAEVSITIHDKDIQRAHRRAQILRAALDDQAPVIPVAFGDHLDTEVEAAARVMGVQVLIVPAEDDEV